jgi:hypothetical protein
MRPRCARPAPVAVSLRRTPYHRSPLEGRPVARELLHSNGVLFVAAPAAHGARRTTYVALEGVP